MQLLRTQLLYISRLNRGSYPIDHEAPKQEEAKPNPARMSEWVVLDITAMTKSTTREKVLKVLKAGGMTVCKVTDPYMNEARSGFVPKVFI